MIAALGRWPRALVGSVGLALLALLPGSGALAQSPATPAAPLVLGAPGSGGVPNLAHIVLVVMENKGTAAIIGNPAAPYLNALASRYAYSAAYSAVAHPSLPNYLALIGGSTYGIDTDCSRCFVSAPNLADTLALAGKSGMAYLESVPGACYTGSTDVYAQKHNPFIYFRDVRQNWGRCHSLVPYNRLSQALAANQLPDFSWITPNICHDMHDCSVATGDQWLAQNLPPLLESPAFTQQDSLLAIVWDEADGGAGNQVPLILAGRDVKRGYVSRVPATHYSLLRTIEDAWGLPPLTANDQQAVPLADFFVQP